MHRRPLASFSILSQIYGPQHHNQQHHKPKPPAAIAKPEVIALAVAAPVAAVVADLPPLEKKKIKITVAKKTSASTSAAAPPVSPVPAPPPAPASPAPMSPRTKKIKITIKQQPKQEKPKQEQQRVESVYTCYHFNDIAPPASFIYTPCGDYIVPPPKCCRFFIENRHCFLRSADNACIDPITKEVFGFWNCEIGKKCELLPPPPTDDDQNDDATSANLVQLDNNDDDDCNKIDALAMRKKSDANRARITGQPVALLRQKIATKHGMHSFNSLGNRR
jgi:hypothetical protein